MMLRLASLAVAATLALGPDVSGVLHLQSPQQPSIPQDQSVPVLPPFDPASSQPQQAAKKDAPLQEDSRLAILRNVDGEFARVVTTLPAGKKGFHFQAGEPIDQNALHKALQISGPALNPGDNVQITRLVFQGQDIWIDLNGGGSKDANWRDRVHMQIGMPVPVQTRTTTTPDNRGPAAPAKKNGATFYLDFGRALPDMTPEQVKQYLSTVLDFSKQRSAAVLYSESLPPKVQEAIAQKRPEVGMDRDEILAAMGRPDRKVRERQEDGTETEDWIYGHPPARTIFVRFTGDKVTQVDQYPK